MRKRSAIATLLGILLPLLVLGAAGTGVFVLMASAPEVERTVEPPKAPLVEAVEVSRGAVPRVVEAFGTVMPAREVEIVPEVSGRIVEMHPALEPGGIVHAGEPLVRIDPAEYELALAQAQGALAEAEAALEVEKGRQLVARREWELFGKDLPNAELGQSLALREPQLRQAEAQIASAQSVVNRAELDLTRTTIFAPFDVLVLRESVDIGQHVTPGSTVATLVGADMFWIRVSVPIERLGAVLDAMANGHGGVRIFSDLTGTDDTALPGRVVRHLGQVDPDGRMAQVLIEVDDPLAETDGATNRIPLALNTYVRTELNAGTLEGVYAIPRKGLRENRDLWVADAHNRLQVRKADILWRQGETLAIADSIEPGDRIVVSPLDGLIPGMEVRVAAEPYPPSESPSVESEA